jgi:ketosteroid isomerase-like protein
MKIAQQFAKSFADEWVQAWNNKDIEAIMSHYADSVVFSSPFILKAQVNHKGTIHGKSELKKYFERALEKNTDLHFDLEHIMVGIKSITLIYTRKKTMLASEAMILDDEGKVVEGLSHYPVEDIYELLQQ